MNRNESVFGMVVTAVAGAALAGLLVAADAGSTTERAVTVAVDDPAPVAAAIVEPGPPPVDGAPVESAEAAIAIVQRLDNGRVDEGSERAVRGVVDDVSGETGLLRAGGAEIATPPELTSTGSLWLVGITGDIRPSFGVAPMTLDWMVFTIDAANGRILSTNGNSGELPAVFDDAGRPRVGG